MFSLRFSGSKFLINLRRQFLYVKYFRVSKIFGTQVLRIKIKITISKMGKLMF